MSVILKNLSVKYVFVAAILSVIRINSIEFIKTNIISFVRIRKLTSILLKSQSKIALVTAEISHGLPD